MKICPVCGSENKEKNKFCIKCGSKFTAEEPIYGGNEFENEKTVNPGDQWGFGSEETMILDDVQTYGGESEESVIANEQPIFENEETVILDGWQGRESEESVIADEQPAFENEETVILDGWQGRESEEPVIADEQPAFENEETVILDGWQGGMSEEPAITDDQAEEPPVAPNFGYGGEIPVYRDPQNDVETETAYIDHLRRLKGLLDDGIINEQEFNQKKQQILDKQAEK